jgi:hypothetical protein
MNSAVKHSIFFILLFVLVIIYGNQLAFPGRDSGVYAYVAQQMLDGKVPYKDIWDHKPPLIYFIDILGLLVGKGDYTGIIVIEYLFLFTAAVFLILFLKSCLGKTAAMAGIVIFLWSLPRLLETGNQVEEYALLFQCASIYLFYRTEHSGRFQTYFLIGILTALSFFLRPNLINIHSAILTCAFLFRIFDKDYKNILRIALFTAAGFVCTSAVIYVYLATNHALDDCRDATVAYNFIYSRSSAYARLKSPYDGLAYLKPYSYLLMVIFPVFLVFSRIWKHPDYAHIEHKKIYYFLLISIVYSMLFTSISGRNYPHYYLSWLPSLAVSAGLFTHFLQATLVNYHKISQLVVYLSLWALLVLDSLDALRIRSGRTFSPFFASGGTNWSSYPMADDIMKLSDDSDFVLLWGAETKLNFITRRRAPSKYSYQYPLFRKDYTTPEMYQKFLDDVKRNLPKLIIDATSIDNVYREIPPLMQDSYRNIDPSTYSNVTDVMDFFNSINSLIRDKYQLYEVTENGCKFYVLQDLNLTAN